MICWHIYFGIGFLGNNILSEYKTQRSLILKKDCVLDLQWYQIYLIKVLRYKWQTNRYKTYLGRIAWYFEHNINDWGHIWTSNSVL